MQITISRNDRYIVAAVTGAVADGDLLEYAKSVMGVLKEYGLKRALLDERRALHESDMFEAYVASESQIITEHAAMGVRLACVIAPGNRARNTMIETLLQNRSVNYRAFESYKEAESWLVK